MTEHWSADRVERWPLDRLVPFARNARTHAEFRTLTPGDFAAVQRQLRHQPSLGADDLVARLRHEASWPPERGRMGF